MRTIGIMILLGVACFWAGRLTGPPKIIEKEEVVCGDYRPQTLAEVYQQRRQDGQALKCENKTYEIIIEKVVK